MSLVDNTHCETSLVQHYFCLLTINNEGHFEIIFNSMGLGEVKIKDNLNHPQHGLPRYQESMQCWAFHVQDSTKQVNK